MSETHGLYHVGLQTVISAFELEKLYDFDESAKIKSMEVTRPGLALIGYFELFDPLRIQIIGKVEWSWLNSLGEKERTNAFTSFAEKGPSAVIITRNLEFSESLIEIAKQYKVPLLRTPKQTSEFMASLISYLNNCLAPRISRHGVFVEVYGEGMLITGDSGVGKSETAIELVKRGHRLIADDVVEIRKISSGTLVGSAPELLRHYVELRGIGIVDIHRIFGMGAVKLSEKIDLVVNLEPWEVYRNYDRLGLENQYMDIMGIKVPQYTIPVHHGRNLAVIMEIAAMNHRQKKMGFNTAEEFNRRLMEQMGVTE